MIFSVNNVPEYIELRSTKPELPLPSEKYLRIHAACCRLAHMSGAAEYLNLMDEDNDAPEGLPEEDFARALAACLYDISQSSAIDPLGAGVSYEE